MTRDQLLTEAIDRLTEAIRLADEAFDLACTQLGRQVEDDSTLTDDECWAVEEATEDLIRMTEPMEACRRKLQGARDLPAIKGK